MAKISKRELNYRVDFTKMTLTMTADFADRAYDPTTEEYEILTRLQKDFPRLRIVRKTHRSPKTANPAKGLTYERMEKYIRLHENADELLDLFQKVQSVGRGYSTIMTERFLTTMIRCTLMGTVLNKSSTPYTEK